MAAMARLTCEMYLLVDRGAAEHDGRERYAQLLALHAACEQDLLARGLDDAHAWLPPSIARRFGRRLAALGWIRDDGWTPYCFDWAKNAEGGRRGLPRSWVDESVMAR